MRDVRHTRRDFIRRGLATGAAMGVLSSRMTTSGLAHAAGANDRIRIGLIGCGIRSNWLASNWLFEAAQAHNAQVVAVCDVWRQKREATAAAMKKKYGVEQKVLSDYRHVLDDKDVDAVLIATPDHQHCTMLIDAVKAGKDVYIEKPIAMELDELNRAYDAVKASKSIVQNGTQGRSCAGASTARDFIQSGKLGTLIRVEESRSFWRPYWNGYRGPEKESDTDWRGFLMHRPYRPFDSDQHGAWMGYRDFSSGTCGGWMSHFIDLCHYITGCGFPVAAVAHGGIFSPTSDRRRTCPDTFTGILEYAEGFTTLYTTHFGNGANDYVTYFGTKGTMQIDAPDGWPNGIRPRVSGVGSDDPQKLPKEEVALENNVIEPHLVNWLKCIRSRKAPIADMEAGYKQGVAVILADRAMVEGRKMTFDPAKREIRPA